MPNAKPQRLDIPSGCTPYTVSNRSTASLGAITLNGSVESIQITADEPGDFSGTVCYAVSGATINNVVCALADTTIVPILPGQAVKVYWEASNIVAVIDYGTIN